MKYKPKFNYVQLEKETDSVTGVRHYKTPSGWVPSVTTILSKTGDQTWLENWKSWVGEKKAEQIRDEAAALGTVVHENIENVILHGKEVEHGTNYIWKLGGQMTEVLLEKGFSRVNEVWAIEEALYMDGLYAGTSDLIGLFDNEEAIMDWKNTRKMKSRDQLGTYCCQTAAYAIAHNNLYGTNIKKIVIMMVDRNLKFEAFEFKGQDFQNSVDEWLNRLEEYYARSN